MSYCRKCGGFVASISGLEAHLRRLIRKWPDPTPTQRDKILAERDELLLERRKYEAHFGSALDGCEQACAS